MRMGLLWFDNSKQKTVRQRIDEGRERYRDRFGSSPDTVHVNPEEVVQHPSLRVVPNRHIRPCHYWLGNDEEGVKSA